MLTLLPSCVLVPHAVASMVSYLSRASTEAAQIAMAMAMVVAARDCLKVIFTSSSTLLAHGPTGISSALWRFCKKSRGSPTPQQLSVLPVAGIEGRADWERVAVSGWARTYKLANDPARLIAMGSATNGYRWGLFWEFRLGQGGTS